MPAAADILDRGRESFGRQAWGDAYAPVGRGRARRRSSPRTSSGSRSAAYLVGRDDDSAARSSAPTTSCLRRGDAGAAARCAFWLAFGLLLRGEMAPRRRLARPGPAAARRRRQRLRRARLPAPAGRR